MGGTALGTGIGFTGTGRIAFPDGVGVLMADVSPEGSPDFGFPGMVLSQPASSAAVSAAVADMVSRVWFIGHQATGDLIALIQTAAPARPAA
ncbi:hypothetical protein MAUB_38250 [Mycolicibacterium aubagnense]|uniref:Uncharacterized protein n=1 Tax=Mycolicibacterium aubagnense TaxID=319707 RepID=A0ABM7IH17_9MYCO|nr:hypothetical protein MAUB_38250 [Mycolicibacterium aubagnense]